MQAFQKRCNSFIYTYELKKLQNVMAMIYSVSSPFIIVEDEDLQPSESSSQTEKKKKIKHKHSSGDDARIQVN